MIILALAPFISRCCRRDPQFTSIIILLVLVQAILPSIASSPIVGASYCKIHFGGNLKSLVVALIRVWGPNHGLG